MAVGRNDRHGVSIDGLEELNYMAERVSPRVALNLATQTVNYIAGEVRKQARRRAPKDSGTLRKAIRNVRRRGKPDTVIVDVRVAHGKDAAHDGFYWHFIEFGTVRQGAQPFIAPTVQQIEPQIPEMYRKEFGKRLEKQLEKEAKKLGVNKR